MALGLKDALHLILGLARFAPLVVDDLAGTLVGIAPEGEIDRALLGLECTGDDGEIKFCNSAIVKLLAEVPMAGPIAGKDQNPRGILV